MKKILMAVVAVLATALPAPALAEIGELDESFGHGGWVLTPTALRTPWSKAKVQLATAADGASFVAAGGKLARYSEDGRLDPAFGGGGLVRIALPNGARFDATDLGVDPQGRAVVTGKASRHGRSIAAVLRYLPDGTLDESFASRGVLLTDFGLEAPTTAAFGLVDGIGQIVILGGVLRRRSRCGETPQTIREDRVLVRLTPEGKWDGSFGSLRGTDVEPLERVTAISPAADGGFVLAGTPRRACGQPPQTALIRLRGNGSHVGRFGLDGTRRFTGVVASVAVDQQDRIVVLCRARRQSARDEAATKIMRLLPGGKLDPELEGGWIVYTTKGPTYRWSTVAIRANGRPVLVGTLIRPPSEKDRRYHRWFLAVPLRDNGRLEDNVSWRGWAWITRVDKHSDAAASEALIDGEGRLLIGGAARGTTLPRGGFALARFELS